MTSRRFAPQTAAQHAAPHGWWPALLCGALAASVIVVPGAVTQAGQVAGRPPAGTPVFVDVTAEAGITFQHLNGASPEKGFEETMGSGGLLFDMDGDGWLDILLVDGGSRAAPPPGRAPAHRLYRNRGNGTFDDVTARSGIHHREYGMGACAGDYDNDGRVDVYITNVGAGRLYRNTGNGAFADVTATAGVGSLSWGTSCGFLDVDRDGHLDLFVTNYVDMRKDANRVCDHGNPPVRVYCHPLNFPPSPNVLYRNNGDGTFADVTDRAGIGGVRGNGLGVAIADYDDDGWPDVFVANDAVPNFLFRNDGHGRFVESALLAGVAVASDGQARAGMGTAFGDYDGDGRLDLVVTNHETEMHSLFRNMGDGLFADVTAASRLGHLTLPYVGFGVVFFDYDNDTHLDLAIVNGHVIDNVAQIRKGGRHAQKRLLLRNTGTGRFEDVSDAVGPDLSRAAVGRGLMAGDIDNDGNLDLLVTNNGGPAVLLKNEGGRGNALLIRLIGTKSNRDALGARVGLTIGSRTLVREVTSGVSYLGGSDTRVHFGMAGHQRADALEIRWPSGLVERVRNVAANQLLTIREGSGITAAVPTGPEIR